jgi:hypothetical protein
MDYNSIRDAIANNADVCVVIDDKVYISKIKSVNMETAVYKSAAGIFERETGFVRLESFGSRRFSFNDIHLTETAAKVELKTKLIADKQKIERMISNLADVVSPVEEVVSKPVEEVVSEPEKSDGGTGPAEFPPI